MSYTAKGEIIEIKEKKSGENAKGAYSYQTFLLKTVNEKNFVQNILFTVWNDKIQYLEKKKVGDTAEIVFSIENKGKDYNNTTAFSIK